MKEATVQSRDVTNMIISESTPRSSPSYSSRLSGEVAARNCSCLPSRAYPDMDICTQLGLVVQDISSFELYSTATFLPT